MKWDFLTEQYFLIVTFVLTALAGVQCILQRSDNASPPLLGACLGTIVAYGAYAFLWIRYSFLAAATAYAIQLLGLLLAVAVKHAFR